MKKIVILFLISIVCLGTISFFIPAKTYPKENFATVVFPVRGRQYWRTNRDIENLTELISVVKTANISSTWLLQYDTLGDKEIIDALKKDESNQEYGIFMEVTYDLAKASFVNYPWETERWERGDKVFLSGYTVENRQKLIDKAFTKFHDQFGHYPKSVGAWHIDSWSLHYLRQRYGVKIAVVCADQYLTDGYQIWGQYWGTPYYPNINNTLEPAVNQEDNLGVLKVQWAMRDPLHGYGIGSDISNYSTQVNDYMRSLKLGQQHFPKLVDTYTQQNETPIGQITLGIEAGELDSSYLPELLRQFDILKQKKIITATLSQFADTFRNVSRGKNITAKITATDGDVSMTWYNTPLYRMAIKKDTTHTNIVDFRVYNTERLRQNEYWFKDQRQNLMKLVPAVIDQVSLKNQLEITPNSLVASETKLQFEARDISVAKEMLKNCACQIKYDDHQVTMIFHAKTNLALQPAMFISSFSAFLQKNIPDFRYTSLSGKHVFGVMVNPRTLLGADLSSRRFGLVHYDYPVLEAFRNFRSYLELNELQFGQDEEQVLKYRLMSKKITTKDAQYGIHNLQQFYQNSTPKFENSKYIVY